MSSTLVDKLRMPAVVHSLIATAMLIYGGNTLLVKMAMAAGAEPLILATLRSAGGSLIWIVIMMLVPGLGLKGDTMSDQFLTIRSIPQTDVQKILFLGVLMMCNVGFGFVAISLLSPVTASLGAPLVPIITAVLGASFGIEQITLPKLISIVISAVGALVVVVWGERYQAGGNGVSEGMMRQAIGWVVLLLNLVSISGAAVLQKPLLNKYPPMFLCCASYLVSSFFLFVVSIVKVGFDADAWILRGDPFLLGVLVYMCVLTTAFNYAVLAWGNKQTSPTVVTTYATLVPVATAILAWLVLGQFLTLGQAVGGFIIAVGLILNVRSQIPDADDAASKPLTTQP